jgi:hypothetical protein
VSGLADAGADTVILQPSPREADDLERFVRFACERVRPLLPE